MIEKIALYVTIILCISIISGTYIYSNKAYDDVLSENIKFAMDKGIDPIAVRCAYASTWKQDNICIMYVTHKETAVDAPVIKKKWKGNIMEFVIKKVSNGFIVSSVDLGDEFIFTKEYQVIRFLKDQFKNEVPAWV